MANQFTWPDKRIAAAEQEAAAMARDDAFEMNDKNLRRVAQGFSARTNVPQGSRPVVEGAYVQAYRNAWKEKHHKT